MIKQIQRFMFKTMVYYGAGSTELIGGEAAKLGIAKAMIVTDRGVRKAGLIKGVEDSLSKSRIKYDVFDEVQEDADVNVVHKVALRIKEAGCNGVVVVGGGSPLCAGKGAAVEVTNNVKDTRELEGWNKAKIPPLPVICLPTTAGSGSDIAGGFPIVDYENKRHFGISGENIAPPVSILDPLLLKTCPRLPMIYAGVDALSHALEAFWGANANPLTDSLAYEAIRLIMTNLKEAALTDNIEAKMNQHLGSTLAMLTAGQAGLGIVHAIGGVHFAFKGGSHGYKCGVVLPHVMEYHLPACENKFGRAAAILGVPAHNRATPELARLFVRQVKQLLIDLDFPRKFAPENLSRAQIPEVLKEIRRNPTEIYNITKVKDEDLARIYEASLKDWELQ